MINHPNRKRVSPSHWLADRCREAGASVQLMWETPGPKDTLIAWLSAYNINGAVCIVETYTDGHGWEALTACQSNDINDTVRDVLARCAPVASPAA